MKPMKTETERIFFKAQSKKIDFFRFFPGEKSIYFSKNRRMFQPILTGFEVKNSKFSHFLAGKLSRFVKTYQKLENSANFQNNFSKKLQKCAWKFSFHRENLKFATFLRFYTKIVRTSQLFSEVTPLFIELTCYFSKIITKTRQVLSKNYSTLELSQMRLPNTSPTTTHHLCRPLK